jgi:hypothetical protein
LANPAQIVGQPILAAAGFQRLLKKAKATSFSRRLPGARDLFQPEEAA